MKKNNFKNWLVVALLATGFSGMAQKPAHPKYINRQGETEKFRDNYQNWAPGTPYSAEAAEDEEFFISRVKPKQRFTHSQTQVNAAMSPDRKMLWWCPLGSSEWNAVPSYHFDSEVFNMWSYVDHYGNWTAPFMRAPGAFMDVCHKNGVEGSVLSSVPWAANLSPTDDSFGQDFQTMIDGGADKLLSFLRYYGIDGIGINSEFNFSSMAPEFRGLLKDANAKRESNNWPTFGVTWYNLMSNSGNVGGGSTTLTSSCQDWFQHDGQEVTENFFLNYHWGGSSLQASQAKAEELSRSSYDVYAGINMQGSRRENWLDFQNYRISIGTWGAHEMNMLFEGRNELGSSPEQQQRTYMLRSERFFTGGSQNPVNTPDVSNLFAYGAESAKGFHGISKFVTARSCLQGDLAVSPFVTYFNMGNGQFFNFQGETTFDEQWYNLGMQDYLPTWRWWFANSFLGRSATDVATDGLKATFTWADAWFGGSCLEVSGSTGTEYLHLFKTKYDVQNGDQLKIRYKVVSGSADVKWACAVEGDEATAIIPRSDILKSGNATAGEWIETVITVGSGIRDINLGGRTLALMGLEFKNASEGFKMLIGEVALTRVAASTPDAPVITDNVNRVLGLNYKGYDFKLGFKMNGTSTDPAVPVYNEDVDTWYYKIYSKQEGEEPVLCTTTTSWAAYVVGAPFNADGAKNVQFGVSAVSLDGNSESDIVWTDLMALPEPTVIEDVVVDKPVIKVDEPFTVKYKDLNHVAAEQWQIINQETGDVEFTTTDATEFTTSLGAIGIYDVAVITNGTTNKFRGLIQISDAAVGALPQILSLKANDSESPVTVKVQDDISFEYTGRAADGQVSRGLRLPEKAFRLPVSQLGLNDKVDSYSLCFWFKSEPFTHGASGTNMLSIRNLNDPWPANNWGYVWNQISPDGTFSLAVRYRYNNGGTATTILDNDYTFEANIWTHLAYVFNWDAGKLTVSIYVNGKPFATIPATSDVYALSTACDLMFGGVMHGRAAFNGTIDEFQFYKKALSAAEVKTSMKHIEESAMPAELAGYWDFESEVNADGYLHSTGMDKTIKGAIMTLQAVPGGNEGETELAPSSMSFVPGAPFIPGANYKIETTAEWDLGDATIVTAGNGNAVSGSAVAKYNSVGDKIATLTLVNGWGTDTKTFNYVRIENTSTGIDGVESGNDFIAYPNPFEDEVNVQFANEGNYTVEVFDMLGQSVYSKACDVSNGQFARISVNAPKGTYLVRILKDDKTVKVIKLVKN